MAGQINGITPQSKIIYDLLLKENTLTAKKIGKRLHILPHAVYRSIKPLIIFGLVERKDSYPVLFQARSVTSAIEEYIFCARETFLETFFPKGLTNVANIASQELDISFIQNRDNLLELSNKDIHHATREVHHIVSGLEVPSDTILELKKAVDRNVAIKFLVQRLDEVNSSMLINWEKMGIKIKYLPLLEARIIIIDKKIVYITSYNPHKKNEATGVRFNYPPIAKLMNELFLQWWMVGKKISDN